MFDAHGTPFDGNHDSDGAGVETVDCTRNFMVYRDGRPFLQVNATLLHARNLLAGFCVFQSDYSWVFKPCHA